MASRLGLNVFTAVSKGDDAVHLILSHPHIDLIMMDVRLGDEIDEIVAMTCIRKYSASVKVIYVTGNNKPETPSRADKTNFEDFLEKTGNRGKTNYAVNKSFAEV